MHANEMSSVQPEHTYLFFSSLLCVSRVPALKIDKYANDHTFIMLESIGNQACHELGSIQCLKSTSKRFVSVRPSRRQASQGYSPARSSFPFLLVSQEISHVSEGIPNNGVGIARLFLVSISDLLALLCSRPRYGHYAYES